MDSFQQIDRHDSRYSEKQRDIKQLVTRMGEANASKNREWDKQFEDTLTDVVLENVLRGGGDRSILHGSERYRSNFDAWIRSCK